MKVGDPGRQRRAAVELLPVWVCEERDELSLKIRISLILKVIW